MLRLAERNRLKASDWLLDTTTEDWRRVEAPPREGLKIQQFDLDANLNGGLVVQSIKDVFDRILTGVGDPPSRTERVGSDGEMAAAVHKAVDGLTRREASDPDLWAHLCCFGCPKYVRWRWTTNKPGAMWLRYAGNIRRNALARLWWWAEVTHNPTKSLGDPKRYEITREVEDRQSLMLYFGDCAFSGHGLLAHGLCDLQDEQSINDDNQKKLCRSVNRLARVVCLDCLDDNFAADKVCKQAFQLSALL
jgi:hypothetical protein